MTNSIGTPYTFYIFWIFCIFTDDCLDSNFIHFRQTNINLVSFNQSIWITSMSKLSPWPIQFVPPYAFCIFWIFDILTDDCLDSNFTDQFSLLVVHFSEFTININDKKWLFHDQKSFFDVIFTKIQFSVIFGIFFSVFAYFFALKSVGRFWIWNMSNNRSKPS